MASWNTFGHEPVKKILDLQAAAGKFGHAYLFSGPAGVGKKTLALEFAARILGTDKLQSHPDFLMLDPEGEITVEHMRDFIARLGLKPLVGPYKVAIVDNAERMNIQSGNALLKTLEEPSPSTVLILVGNSRHMLPTIISRCLVLNFCDFSPAQLKAFAKSRALDASDEMLKVSFRAPGKLVELAASPQLLQQKSAALKNWQRLKQEGAGERLLEIADLAALETNELSDMLKTWLYAEEEQLPLEPENFTVLAALSGAVEALSGNQNKKSVLQNLFLRIK